MPTIITQLMLELVSMASPSEEGKVHLVLINQLREELGKLRPFETYEELDLILGELKEDKPELPERTSKVKAQKLEKMKKKQLKCMEAH